MWTFALFYAKDFGFFEIYGVSARIRREGVGVESLWIFCRQGGSIFAIMCVGLLWTAPYNRQVISHKNVQII